MKCVSALYLMACVAYAQSNEPEPEMYSTTMDSEPSPESMSVTSPATSAPATSTGAPMNSVNATTTAPAPKHTITIAATLSNLSSYSSISDLADQLKTKLMGSVQANSQVEVKIKSLQVKVVYGGMPDPLPDDMVDDISNATYKMYDGAVELRFIRVNNKTHSSMTGRRLNTGTATVITRVENDPNSGEDIVAKTKELQSKTSASAMLAKLKEVDATKYENQNVTGGEPEIKIEAETIITGQNTAPSTDELQTGLDGIVSGIEVTSVSSENAVTTSAPLIDPVDDHAPIAPMVTIWAALFAFVMS